MRIYYSVENGGDGSAYPRFFETLDLADWHQDHLSEGWGESCTGSIEVNGDNITCPSAIGVLEYYVDELSDLYDEDGAESLKEFIKKFLPDGVPTFTVTIVDEKMFGVFVDEIWVKDQYAHPDASESTRAGYEKELNSLNWSFD